MRKDVKSQAIGISYTKRINKRDKESVYLKAEILSIMGADYLRAILYKGTEAAYITICDKENTDYITWDIRGQRWTTAMLINLGGYYSNTFYNVGKYKYVNTESETIGSQYLGVECFDNTACALRDWQLRQKEYSAKIRWQNSERRDREVMDQVGELPSDIDRFIDNVVLKESRYLYYETNKNKMLCFCSHCRKSFEMDRPKHFKGSIINKTTTCPQCHSKVIIKSKARAPMIFDKGWFSYIQKAEDGIIIRYYEVIRLHTSNYHLQFKNNLCETLRTYIGNDGKMTFYENKETTGEYIGRQPARWRHVAQNHMSYSGYRTEGHSGVGYLYTRDVNKQTKGTAFCYSGIAHFARGSGEFIVSEYMEAYRMHKYVEYLSKIGMTRLVFALMDRNDFGADNNGKTIMQILGVNKQDYKSLLKINPYATELYFWRWCRINGVAVDTELIKHFRTIWIKEKHSYGTSYLYDRLRDISKYISLRKFIPYAKKQENIRTFLGDYIDYINAAAELEFDLSSDMILRPKNFKAMHDSTIAMLDTKKNAQTDIEIKKRYKENIGIYSYSSDKYLITLPNSFKQLRDEGKKLNHCVVRYADKVADGTCIILLIRDANKPKTPFCTAEIRNNELWQLRGKNNSTVPKDVKDFFEKYKYEVLEKLKFKNARKAG